MAAVVPRTAYLTKLRPRLAETKRMCLITELYTMHNRGLPTSGSQQLQLYLFELVFFLDLDHLGHPSFFAYQLHRSRV